MERGGFHPSSAEIGLRFDKVNEFYNRGPLAKCKGFLE